MAQKYKQTQIGKIPEEWRVVKLTDAADYINGYGFSPKEWKSKGLPIIRIQNLNDSKARFNYFDGKVEDKYLVENDDLLFPWSASIGVYIWDREKAVLNQHIFKVIPKKGVDKQYLYYALFLAIEHLKKRVHGSTMKHFKRGELDITFIPLPPIPEQKAIAKILSTADEAIQKSGEIIAKTVRLKKGLMRELLTKGIRHEEFKDTEIGRIPEKWGVVKLEDVSLDFVSGGTPSTANPDYWNGDIDWMTSAHINGRTITSGQRYIPKEGLKNSATKLVPKNNLLVATRVGVGKAAINEIDIAISQDLTGIIIDRNKFIPDFLYWHILNKERVLKSLAQGSTIKGILRGDLGKLKIPLPPLPEQQKIALILSTVERKLEIDKARKQKYERIKKGLMNDLLTGNKKVKIGG